MNAQPVVTMTMTPEQFQSLIRQAVRDTLLELLGNDVSLEPAFRPDIAERLREFSTRKTYFHPDRPSNSRIGLDE